MDKGTQFKKPKLKFCNSNSKSLEVFIRLLIIISRLPVNKNLFQPSFKKPSWLIKPIIAANNNKIPEIKNALGSKKRPRLKQIEPKYVILFFFF